MDSQDISCAQNSPRRVAKGKRKVISLKGGRNESQGYLKGVNVVSSSDCSSSDDCVRAPTRRDGRKKRRQRSLDVKGRRGEPKIDLDDLLEDLSFSDLEAHDINGRGARPYNCFGDVDVDREATYYRCNLQTAISEIRGIDFTKEHCCLLKNTPMCLFDGLRQPDLTRLHKRMRKSDDSIRELLLSCNTEIGGFVVG